MKDKNDDDALWQEAVKGAKPLSGRKKHTGQPLPKKPLKLRRNSPDFSAPDYRSPPDGDIAAASHGVDRRTDEKLRRGRMPIDRRIDLHGMTRDEAYAALGSIVTDSYETGARCLLVITGKGRAGSGVLKACVPEWLRDESMGSIVLRVYPAQPQHGGSGAFYVLVKRKR